MYRIDDEKKGQLKLRGIKFFLIGGFVALLDTSLTWFFIKILNFKINYGVTLSYFLSVSTHFTLNNLITFRDSKAHIIKKIIGYIYVIMINYVLTLIIVNLTLKFITNQIVVAKILSIATTFFTSFFGMKYFVFKTNNKAEDL